MTPIARFAACLRIRLVFLPPKVRSFQMDVRTEMSGEHTRKLTQFGYQRVGAKVSDTAEPNNTSRLANVSV